MGLMMAILFIYFMVGTIGGGVGHSHSYSRAWCIDVVTVLKQLFFFIPNYFVSL